mmetsp:Transcript_20119/g.57543  ORF Transcript_20119/g.57543 Transcript_20119/m.57543 type:complete len:99 (+) Transcript_20119:1599-1895(+)
MWGTTYQLREREKAKWSVTKTLTHSLSGREGGNATHNSTGVHVPSPYIVNHSRDVQHTLRTTDRQTERERVEREGGRERRLSSHLPEPQQLTDTPTGS